MSNLEQAGNKIKSKPLNVVQAILDNLLLIAAIAVIGIILVVSGAILTHKPYYSVSSSILFKPHIPELVYESNERYLHSFEDWMRTQAHEIESYGVLDEAINAYEKKGFRWMLADESIKNASDRLRGRLDISQINNTQIMTVSLGSSQQEGIAELVNLVVDKFIQHKDLQRKVQDQKKLKHLRSEREKYSKRLDEAYRDLMKVSRKYATAVADEKNLYIYLNMFMDLRSRYNQVLTNRIETENKLGALKNQKNRILEMNVFDLDNTKLLVEMEQEIKAKMVGLNPDSEQHRQFSEILDSINRKNIETARKYLISEIDKEINEQDMLNESAVKSEKDLKVELKKAQVEVMEFNTAVLRASTQRQEIDRIINIWNRINERIEQVEIELFNPGRVNVLSAALKPDFPNPNKLVKKILLGIVAMLGMAFGAAILKDIMDNRIKRTADIEKVLGFPATGYLLDSKAEDILPENLLNITGNHPESFMAELFNQLTVRVEKEHMEHGSKTFTLFSLKGQSGITTIASNILTMLDSDKSKKILVSLNTRDSLNAPVDDPGKMSGLSPWLSDNRNLEQCIVKNNEMEYDVLPLGNFNKIGLTRIPPSAIDELLSILKKNYNYILIEGPAILLSSEAQSLAQKSDVSLIVLDAQKDTWPELIRTVNLLHKLKINVVSVILNKVKLLRAGYLKKTIKEYYSNRKNTLQDTPIIKEVAA